MKITVHECKVLEGVDVDYANLQVRYNPSHQDNVNTSIEDNPTVDKSLYPGVEVWSVFTRNRNGDDRDGNPLVYALKGERGWKFRSNADRKAIEQQFSQIADKFLAEHKYDVTVVAPSKGPLNDYIVSVLASKDPDIEYIPDVLLKLSTGDVEEMIEDKDSKFVRTYRDDINRARRQLLQYFDRMDRERDGVFTRHFVTDSKMRDVLDMTLKNNDSLMAEDAAKITDHDVLIIDDTISRGQTAREAIKTIKSCYHPKSVTVLTLFSKLQR